jgi:hypothetical protein
MIRQLDAGLELNNLATHQYSLAEITSIRVSPSQDSRPVSQPKFDSHVCSGGSESIKADPNGGEAFSLMDHGQALFSHVTLVDGHMARVDSSPPPT